MKYLLFVSLCTLLLTQKGYSYTDTTKLNSYDTSVKYLTVGYKDTSLSFNITGTASTKGKPVKIIVKKGRIGKLLFAYEQTKKLSSQNAIYQYLKQNIT